MKRYSRTIKFTKGDKLHLDQIYNIQGIESDGSNSHWWEHIKDDSDDIIITKDITIQITVWSS